MPFVGPANQTPLQRRQILRSGKEKTPTKLPKILIAEMMAVTIAIDACQWGLDWIGFGLVINPILDWTVIPLLFYIWFKIIGLNLNSARKSITFFAGAFIDGLEASAIPLWTIDIGLVIFFEKSEEALAGKAGLINKSEV